MAPPEFTSKKIGTAELVPDPRFSRELGITR